MLFPGSHGHGFTRGNDNVWGFLTNNPLTTRYNQLTTNHIINWQWWHGQLTKKINNDNQIGEPKPIDPSSCNDIHVTLMTVTVGNCNVIFTRKPGHANNQASSSTAVLLPMTCPWCMQPVSKKVQCCCCGCCSCCSCCCWLLLSASAAKEGTHFSTHSFYCCKPVKSGIRSCCLALACVNTWWTAWAKAGV